MKSIFLYLLSFTFLFTACISEKVVNIPTADQGSISISVEKVSYSKELNKLVVILKRHGYETIQKTLNLTGNATSTISSNGLPVGVWHVDAKIFNKDNEIVYSGGTDIVIRPDFNITLFLKLNKNTNDLEFNISFGEGYKKSLVAFYPFYGNAKDYSGYKNNGVVYGAQLTEDRFGNKNSAYYFDGIDDYIRVTDDNSLTPSDQKLTLAVWMKKEDSKNKTIIYKGDRYNNREYSLGISKDSAKAGFGINDQGLWQEHRKVVNSKLALNDNQWYFLVAVWDGYEMKIYINGKLDNSNVTNATIGNYDSDLFIGTYGGAISRYAFKGIIDDIAIFNEALSSTEIEQIYNITK